MASKSIQDIGKKSVPAKGLLSSSIQKKVFAQTAAGIQSLDVNFAIEIQ